MQLRGGGGDTPTLHAVALDTVRALAAVNVPVNTGGVKPKDGASDKGSEKAEGEKPLFPACDQGMPSTFWP